MHRPISIVTQESKTTMTMTALVGKRTTFPRAAERWTNSRKCLKTPQTPSRQMLLLIRLLARRAETLMSMKNPRSHPHPSPRPVKKIRRVEYLLMRPAWTTGQRLETHPWKPRTRHEKPRALAKPKHLVQEERKQQPLREHLRDRNPPQKFLRKSRGRTGRAPGGGEAERGEAQRVAREAVPHGVGGRSRVLPRDSRRVVSCFEAMRVMRGLTSAERGTWCPQYFDWSIFKYI